MKHRSTACLSVLFVFALAHSAFAEQTTFTISKPMADVFTASVQVLSVDMELTIKSSNDKVGQIAAEFVNGFGESTNHVNVVIEEKDGVTTVSFQSKKRRFSIGGGKPTERMAQYKAGLERRLQVKVEQGPVKK